MEKPLKTKKEYEIALQHIYQLMQKDFKSSIKHLDELKELSILVEAYEKEHFPIPPLSESFYTSEENISEP